MTDPGGNQGDRRHPAGRAGLRFRRLPRRWRPQALDLALGAVLLACVAGLFRALLPDIGPAPGPAVTVQSVAPDRADPAWAADPDRPHRPRAAPPVPAQAAILPPDPPPDHPHRAGEREGPAAEPAHPPPPGTDHPASARVPGTPVPPVPGPPPPDASGPARVVVVIDDMGLDRRRSDRVVALPGPLTLAWLPYAGNLVEQTAAARARGHQLIMHVPMQPDGPADPGPNALLTGLDAAEIRRRLALNLSAFPGFVAINNHMGSRFTADSDGMAVVLAELAARGLFFLDSRTTARTVAPDLAPGLGVPLLSRDVFLDHEMTPTAVALALTRLEALARRQGTAIAIGHPHDVTIQALARWLPRLRERGFELIPLSAALAARPSGS